MVIMGTEGIKSERAENIQTGGLPGATPDAKGPVANYSGKGVALLNLKSIGALLKNLKPGISSGLLAFFKLVFKTSANTNEVFKAASNLEKPMSGKVENLEKIENEESLAAKLEYQSLKSEGEKYLDPEMGRNLKFDHEDFENAWSKFESLEKPGIDDINHFKRHLINAHLTRMGKLNPETSIKTEVEEKLSLWREKLEDPNTPPNEIREIHKEVQFLMNRVEYSHHHELLKEKFVAFENIVQNFNSTETGAKEYKVYLDGLLSEGRKRLENLSKNPNDWEQVKEFHEKAADYVKNHGSDSTNPDKIREWGAFLRDRHTPIHPASFK